MSDHAADSKLHLLFFYFIAFEELQEFKPAVQAARATIGVSDLTRKLQMTSLISEAPQLDTQGSVFYFSLSFSRIMWKSQLLVNNKPASWSQLSCSRCFQWGFEWDASHMFPAQTEDTNTCAFSYCGESWTNHRLETSPRKKNLTSFCFQKLHTHSIVSPGVTIPDCDLQWAPLPKLLMKASASAKSPSEPLDGQEIFTVVRICF